jgi:ribosome biogenesis GTPase
MRIENISPMVGDRVIISITGGEGRIDTVLPRRNTFVRPPVANLDTLALVVSTAPPRSDPAMADRLTVAAERQKMDVVIIVNKCDIDTGEEWRRRYAASGYPFFAVSAETGEGIVDLYHSLAGKHIVLAGHSGVGKSSILNALAPELSLRVGNISARTGRGKHTTRHVELLPLPNQCLIADTPGFSVFETGDAEFMEPDEIAQYFPEFRKFLGQCRYRGCRHNRDEGCAVSAAAESGEIDAGRRRSYIDLCGMMKRSYEK